MTANELDIRMTSMAMAVENTKKGEDPIPKAEEIFEFLMKGVVKKEEASISNLRPVQ